MKFRSAGLMVLLAGLVQAQEMEFQVELMNRVGTDTSRRGDLVTARILSPAGFQGSVVEGKVTEAISGPKIRGKSVLAFAFDTLRHGGTGTPIQARMMSVVNPKEEIDVDAGGRIISRAGGSPPPPSRGTSGLGRALGGLGGGSGARIGGAVDSTASAGARTSAAAPELRFEPGWKFVLKASARSGPALASLVSAPATESASAPASAPAKPAPGAAPVPQPASATSGQPELTAVKAEFIPGDKTIFFDDFTDMTGDEAPPHWKVRGGTAELRTGEGVRQITSTARRTTLTPNLTGLPKNFTMESVMKYNGHGVVVQWTFRGKAGQEVMHMRLGSVYTKMDILFRVGKEIITSQQLVMDWTKPIRQALWLQKGRLRLYLNGERVFDANQIDIGEVASVEADLMTSQSAGQTEKYAGFQSVRFAESFPDFSQVITSAGRYIVRGILFDTDSDRIKPESAPVIKQIAKGLEGNPNLKLLIEGHTDSVGDAAHNLDLSKRRAEAVRAVLVGQFQVDAARLNSAGMGATKPVESNDTPLGRAQNRRVELVRQ
jgi:OOP family OmpA-OmpF porin